MIQHLGIYIFWFIAAMFNAVMDRTENSVAFNKSKFSHLNPKFWCKDISWEYAKILPFTRYKLDAWHIAKTLMIISLAFSLYLGHNELQWWEIFVLGAIWNGTFTLFYHNIFKKK